MGIHGAKPLEALAIKHFIMDTRSQKSNSHGLCFWCRFLGNTYWKKIQNGYRIKLSDICCNFEPAELTPRFYVIPLCHLLDSNLFEDPAMTWAEEIQRDLEEKAKNASAANDNMEKVESAKKAKETTTIHKFFKNKCSTFVLIWLKRKIFLLTLL